MRAPDFWTRQDAASRIAVAALSPFGWAYGAVTDWKRAHATPYRPRAKVVCVGNLTVGGAGKTPIVRALAEILRAQGRKPIALSRGYGGRLTEATLVDPTFHGFEDVGDEPLMIAARVPVIVSRNRKQGAMLAESEGADVIVMDDGYQNFALEKDLSIVVVDAQTAFGNGRIVPAGPMRERLATGLARADLVLLVGDGTPELPGYAGPVLRAKLVPHEGTDFGGRRAVAFAGIGRPEKFFLTLKDMGVELAEKVAFPDHHVYSAKEIARLRSKAKQASAMLITTEKDYVRLPDRDGISLLPIKASFDAPDILRNVLMAKL